MIRYGGTWLRNTHAQRIKPPDSVRTTLLPLESKKYITQTKHIWCLHWSVKTYIFPCMYYSLQWQTLLHKSWTHSRAVCCSSYPPVYTVWWNPSIITQKLISTTSAYLAILAIRESSKLCVPQKFGLSALAYRLIFGCGQENTPWLDCWALGNQCVLFIKGSFINNICALLPPTGSGLDICKRTVAVSLTCTNFIYCFVFY